MMENQIECRERIVTINKTTCLFLAIRSKTHSALARVIKERNTSLVSRMEDRASLHSLQTLRTQQNSLMNFMAKLNLPEIIIIIIWSLKKTVVISRLLPLVLCACMSVCVSVFLCVCVYVKYVSTCMCRCLPRLEEKLDSPGLQ